MSTPLLQLLFIISQELQSLYITAIWLRHHSLRGVDSVCLQILLMDVLTMWFMVCRWPQSQEGDWARPHLCKSAWHGPWPVRKWFISDYGHRLLWSTTLLFIYLLQLHLNTTNLCSLQCCNETAASACIIATMTNPHHEHHHLCTTV